MNVLISGASVAGPVLAYWLARAGFSPVVVERTPRPRLGLGGHAVDLFAPAMEVARRMGIVPALREAALPPAAIRLERPGRRAIDTDLADLSDAFADGNHLEVMRGELASTLHDATRDDVEYVFGDSIRTLAEDAGGVDVTFDSGLSRRFDLVIGADGLHSNVRRLAFGPERDFLHHLGGYLAVFTLPDHLGLEGRTVLYNAVDRVVAMYAVPGTGQARAVLLFRAGELAYDHRDVAEQKRLLRKQFAGAGWEVPRLLDAVDDADDFYLDAIGQIRMDTWTRGRVTLVGDAGYSPGPAVGGGTTLAMAAAYVLARALADARGDHTAAFAAYEHGMRDYVLRCRGVAPRVLRNGVPRSPAHVALTAFSLRLLPRLPRAIRRRALANGASSTLSSFTLPGEDGPSGEGRRR
ncbi:FAD-dependent monooxygenase [Prauserella flavalba]|uniref:2-polyprenyl-6-methoxyphenol hydroxylase n=1 Tax=Prauserella flavalba TaxID=1477506 RepID=A0A318LAI6_9PSEU|nr:FAD-dependent monooxygenase [Prauserella flavalba]PXY18538.1 2-polyprenyl-6-methoxyphenol hydroxylase [Prauserella flavalba]